MTPRSVIGRNASSEFPRQVAEHTKNENGEPPTKKFKSTHAPKGTKLAQGYNDRTSTRHGEEESDKVKKLKELEKMVKEEKIDQATFEKLRDQMGIGGDLSTTHLVKGLDFKLLDRARRGDDLNETSKKQATSEAADPSIDEELDNVLDRDITARKPSSSGTQADADESAEAHLMSRDEILRRLKQSRNNVGSAPAPDPVLGNRFKKLAPVEKPGRKKFVETIDGRRREVLIITKDDGTTKRKTRWLDPEPPPQKSQGPLGMEVPAELAAKQRALAEQEAAEDEDEDIFAGVGADYDPLKGIESDQEDEKVATAEADDASKAGPRNYFSTNTEEEQGHNKNPIMHDPTLLAALKRAAALRQDEEAASREDSKPDSDNKSRQFLNKLKERERQDAQDLDLGFGDSRYADDDDDDVPIYEDGDEPGKQKRKRGPKKRKGNKDNVADVMSVLDGRKK